MSGVLNKPLGFDESGRSYWKFASSNGLFISPNSTDTKQEWVLLTEISQIAQVINALKSSSSAEKELRKNLSVVFYHDFAEKKDQMKPSSEEKEDTGDAKDIQNDDTSASGEENEHNNDNEENHNGSSDRQNEEEAEDGNSDENDEEEEEEEEDAPRVARPKREMKSRAVVETKKLPPVPTLPSLELKLFTNKGVCINEVYVMKQEKIFEDADEVMMDDDNDENLNYQEYFAFNRSSRYYAIGLAEEATGKLFKLPKNGNFPAITITFQVHRAGVTQSLSYTPLSEAWSDGYYYFSTLNFKKSGNYTLSFILECSRSGGANTSTFMKIKPLVYATSVIAERVISGVYCALERFNAFSYANVGSVSDRQITYKRRDLWYLAHDTVNYNDEFIIARNLIILFYLALPEGSLIMCSDTDDRNNKSLVDTSIANTCWNSMLDAEWRDNLLHSTTVTQLMECLLLLEYYIAKNWFSPSCQNILSLLPPPHFAIRGVTYSMLALRLYILDRSLLYDKVQRGLKGSRAVMGELSNNPVPTKPSSSNIAKSSSATVAVPFTRSTRNSGGGSSNAVTSNNKRSRGKVTSYAEDSDDGVEDVSAYSSRPRRAAMDRARQQLTSLSNQADYDSDGELRRSKRNRESRESRGSAISEQENETNTRTEWICPNCKQENEQRARSCASCFERKPPTTAPHSSRATPRNARVRKRNKEKSSSSSEDNNNDETSESEGDGDESNTQSSSRKKSKKATNEYWNSTDNKEEEQEEDDEEEEEDFDFEELIAERQTEFDNLMESDDNLMSEDTKTKINLMSCSICMLRILSLFYDDEESIPFWSEVDDAIYPDYRYGMRESWSNRL